MWRDVLVAFAPAWPALGAFLVTALLLRRKPPSELSTCPTTQRPSSLTSHPISRAGSSGSPIRRCGNAFEKEVGASSR